MWNRYRIGRQVAKWNKISVSGHAFLCLWKCKYTALRGLFHWYPTASSCLWLYKSSCCAASSERSNKFLPARVVRDQQLFHPLLLPRRIYRRCCLLRPRSRVLLRWRGSSASCTRLITLVLVSMAAYLWYMTVLAMLLRGGGGGVYIYISGMKLVFLFLFIYFMWLIWREITIRLNIIYPFLKQYFSFRSNGIHLSSLELCRIITASSSSDCLHARTINCSTCRAREEDQYEEHSGSSGDMCLA